MLELLMFNFVNTLLCVAHPAARADLLASAVIHQHTLKPPVLRIDHHNKLLTH
jgi:hypothetical protein